MSVGRPEEPAWQPQRHTAKENKTKLTKLQARVENLYEAVIHREGEAAEPKKGVLFSASSGAELREITHLEDQIEAIERHFASQQERAVDTGASSNIVSDIRWTSEVVAAMQDPSTGYFESKEKTKLINLLDQVEEAYGFSAQKAIQRGENPLVAFKKAVPAASLHQLYNELSIPASSGLTKEAFCVLIYEAFAQTSQETQTAEAFGKEISKVLNQTPLVTSRQLAPIADQVVALIERRLPPEAFLEELYALGMEAVRGDFGLLSGDQIEIIITSFEAVVNSIIPEETDFAGKRPTNARQVKNLLRAMGEGDISPLVRLVSFEGKQRLKAMHKELLMLSNQVKGFLTSASNPQDQSFLEHFEAYISNMDTSNFLVYDALAANSRHLIAEHVARYPEHAKKAEQVVALIADLAVLKAADQLTKDVPLAFADLYEKIRNLTSQKLSVEAFYSKFVTQVLEHIAKEFALAIVTSPRQAAQLKDTLVSILDAIASQLSGRRREEVLETKSVMEQFFVQVTNWKDAGTMDQLLKLLDRAITDNDELNEMLIVFATSLAKKHLFSSESQEFEARAIFMCSWKAKVKGLATNLVKSLSQVKRERTKKINRCIELFYNSLGIQVAGGRIHYPREVSQKQCFDQLSEVIRMVVSGSYGILSREEKNTFFAMVNIVLDVLRPHMSKGQIGKLEYWETLSTSQLVTQFDRSSSESAQLYIKRVVTLADNVFQDKSLDKPDKLLALRYAKNSLNRLQSGLIGKRRILKLEDAVDEAVEQINQYIKDAEKS